MTDLNTVNQTESKIEADVQALTTAVGSATSAIQTENASIADLRAQIAALQAGGGATPADLDALNTKLAQVSANIEAQTNALQAASAPPAPAPAA